MNRSALGGAASSTLGAAALLCLFACRSAELPSELAGEPEAPHAPPTDPAGPVDLDGKEPAPPEVEIDPVTLAIDAIGAGDYAEARELLAGLLVTQYLAEARSHLASNSPEDALPAVDRVLELRSRHEEGVMLKAHASLALAEKEIAGGGNALLVEGALLDAVSFYARAGDDIEALLGASRSAHLLGRADDALAYAQRAKASLQGKEENLELRLLPERVHAEAAYGSYVGARTSEAASEKVRELFDETEFALSDLLGRRADEAWGWSTFADLYLWESMLDDARSILERGLDRLPDNEGLLRKLVDVSRRAGGSAAAVETLAAYNERHPDIPLAMWFEAMERFNVVVEGVMAIFGEDYVAPEDPEALPRAIAETEQLLARCRELEESYGQACLGYEVMCRAALGWSRYGEKRFDDAVAAFKSMDDILPRGMEWQIEGRLLSGLMGLHFCGRDQGDANPLVAGELYEFLHLYQPDDENWANNAGLYLRDAAVNIELVGRRLCNAYRGEESDPEILAYLRRVAEIEEAQYDTDAEKTRFREVSNEAIVEARDLMERSYSAYKIAAELAPDDVRIVNDTALDLVYYLHRDYKFAEELLLKCVEMGAEQVKDETLEETPRFDLENAWGDAFQNLGVLYANHKNDPEGAIAWFEKAIEIGPEPRPLLSNFWIPLLRGELDPSADQDLLTLKTWADPCE